MYTKLAICSSSTRISFKILNRSYSAGSWSNVKKFWKNAGVKQVPEGYSVQIDGRQVKTPTGKPIILPEERKWLADMVAGEWESIEKLKAYSLPLTSLVARALEDFADPPQKQKAIDDLVKFVNTDSILYRQPYPDSLVEMQRSHWDPIVDWAKKEYGINIVTTDGILSGPQPAETREKLREIVESMDAFELASFERAVVQTKSFLTALALVKRSISVEEAADAARVEVNHQISTWGEVEDTHDVDREDIKRQLGSAVIALH